MKFFAQAITGISVLVLCVGATNVSAADNSIKTQYKIKSKIISPGYSIELPTPDSPYRPSLGSDHTVSAISGLYGQPIGSSYQDIEKQFGTPGFIFKPTEDTTIVAYGRDHWLTFHNNKLIRAQFESTLFNNTLTNYFEFDDRFDDRKWEVMNELKQGSEVEQQQLAALSQNNSSSASLILHTDVLFKNNQEYKTVEISGFTLSSANTDNAPVYDFTKSANSLLAQLNQKLQNLESASVIDVRDIVVKPLGKTQTSDKKRYYLYDPHTLVETVGFSVSRIIVTPDLMAEKYVKDTPWKFGEFSFNMPKDKTIKLAGDNAFAMNDYVEFERDDYVAKIYFEEIEDKPVAYSMELVVY